MHVPTFMHSVLTRANDIRVSENLHLSQDESESHKSARLKAQRKSMDAFKDHTHRHTKCNASLTFGSALNLNMLIIVEAVPYAESPHHTPNNQ